MPARKGSRSAAPPPSKSLFDSGNFNFGKLVWCPWLFFAINWCPPVIVLAPAFCQIFERIIPKTPKQKRPFDQRRAIKKSAGLRHDCCAVCCSHLVCRGAVLRCRHGDTAPWLQPADLFVAASTATSYCRPKIENSVP